MTAPAMDSVEAWVVAYLAQRLSRDEAAIQPAALLVEDLGADSLDTVEMLMDAEAAFDIQFTDEQAAAIATVADAIDCIAARVREARAG